MIYKLLVPGPIEDVEQVRVLEWHGGEGQAFAEGELVVELETHKALVEVRAGQAGILRSVISQEGDWVDIGSPLGLLSDKADEPVPESLEELAEMALSFEVS